MIDPYDSDAGRRDFAIERSHKDSASSNDAARATAQAVILINGGAATAILAFLSKIGLSVIIINVAAICLALYAIGVGAGAFMLFCSTRALDYYGVRWRLAAHPQNWSTEEEQRLLAAKWWVRMQRSFYASITIFLMTSLLLAIAMLWANLGTIVAPSPQASPSATSRPASALPK